MRQFRLCHARRAGGLRCSQERLTPTWISGKVRIQDFGFEFGLSDLKKREFDTKLSLFFFSR